MDILETIAAHKRVEVEQLRRSRSSGATPMHRDRPFHSMRHALESSSTGIIAEFKRRSPSKGWIHEEARVAGVLPSYERAGATACSILTDNRFFGGTLNDLVEAGRCTPLPLLRKDFIIDELQIEEACEAGADAVLLIAALLTREECCRLTASAHALGLEVLLEIHSLQELGRVEAQVDMLGVNNRNLGTFVTDVNNSYKLAAAVRGAARAEGAPLLVSESGLSLPLTVSHLRAQGYRGFLMGEAFMKEPCPGDALAQFICELKKTEKNHEN